MLPRNVNPARQPNNVGKRTAFWPRALTILPILILLTAGLYILQKGAIIDAVRVTIDHQFKKNPQMCNCNAPVSSGADSSSSSTTTYTMRDFPDIEDLSAASDRSWNTMFNTPQGGFLWVKHNETMNLAWGVSMFHAIHCLTLLREQVQMDQNLKNATMGHNPHNDHQLPGHSAFDSTHVGHCFSYIAQMILCAGDDTIEPPWFVEDENGNIVDAGVDGMGYSHQCRDASLTWNTIMKTEKEPIEKWSWGNGDTVQKIFGNRG